MHMQAFQVKELAVHDLRATEVTIDHHKHRSLQMCYSYT